MSVTLRQLKVNCPACGEYMFEVKRLLTNLDTRQTDEILEDPACRKCNPVRYNDLLRNAIRITVLHVDERGNVE